MPPLRVILIPAPAFRLQKLRQNFPIGLYSIKGVARRAGFEIDVLAFPDDILDREFSSTQEVGDAILSLFDPGCYDIIGLSTVGGVFSISIYIAEKIKRRNQNAVVVLGGQHSSFLPAETLNDFSFVDAVVVGEGEITFREMLLAFRKSPDDWRDLPGVMIRNGRFVKRDLIEDLDDLPFINYNPDLRLKDSTDYGRVEASRGCNQRCRFCDTSLFWECKVRRKSPARLVEEMIHVARSTDLSRFLMIGDNFTSPIKACREACRHMIRAGTRLQWGCAARIGELEKDDLKLMKDAGCFSIFVGIESASQTTLDRIHKKINLDKTISMIEAAVRLGFEIGVSQIVGFPWETEEDILATLRQHSRLYDLGVSSSNIVGLMPKKGTAGFFSESSIVSDIDRTKGLLPFYCQDDYSIRMIRTYPHQFFQFSYFETPHLRRSLIHAVIETAHYITGIKLAERKRNQNP